MLSGWRISGYEDKEPVAESMQALSARPPGAPPPVNPATSDITITGLPNDLLEMVLANVRSVSDVLTARQVCRRWRYIIDNSAAIWKAADFAGMDMSPRVVLGPTKLARPRRSRRAELEDAQIRSAIHKSTPFTHSLYNAIAKVHLSKGILFARGHARAMKVDPALRTQSHQSNKTKHLAVPAGEPVVRLAAAAHNPWAELLEAIVFDRKPVFRALTVEQPLATDLVTFGLRCQWPKNVKIDAIQGELRLLLRYGGWVIIHAAKSGSHPQRRPQPPPPPYSLIQSQTQTQQQMHSQSQPESLMQHQSQSQSQSGPPSQTHAQSVLQAPSPSLCYSQTESPSQSQSQPELPSGAVVGLLGIQPSSGGNLEVRQRVQLPKPIYCAGSVGLWVPSLFLSETIIRACQSTGCI